MANVSVKRGQSELVCYAEREKRRAERIKKPAREDLSILVRRHVLNLRSRRGYFLYVKLAALTLWLSGPIIATNSPGSATSLRSLL